jgi:hypothetical protein
MSPRARRPSAEDRTIAILARVTAAGFGLVFGALVGWLVHAYWLGDLLGAHSIWLVIGGGALVCALLAVLYGQQFWTKLNTWVGEWL